MTPDGASARTLEARLAEHGVVLAPDELEELAAAYPALMAWVRIAEELAADDPGFISPLDETHWR